MTLFQDRGDPLNPPQLSLGGKIASLNWGLVILILLVASVGFAMLYSAANGDWNPWASRQIVRFGAGNVDAEEYACPHEVRLDRKRISGHLAFSQGPRICPGANISRIEQHVAWSRLLDRIDRLEYAPGCELRHQPGIMLGTLALRLRFRRADAVPAG